MSGPVVALSFVGRGQGYLRAKVRQIAATLVGIYGPEAVFFDEDHREALSSLDGGQRLEAAYQAARLIVVFLTPEYGQSDAAQWWTRREWDAAYDRLVHRRTDDVLLFMSRLDPAGLDALQLPGLSSARAFPTPIDDREPDLIAGDIVLRLDRLQVSRTAGPKQAAPEVVRAAYRQTALRLYGRVSMVGLQAELMFDMNDIYVPLSIQVRPKEMLLEGRWHPLGPDGGTVGIEDVFKHTAAGELPVVMGEAGSGKTTALKKVLHRLLKDQRDVAGLPTGVMPVFVRAAEMKADLSKASGAGALRAGRGWLDGPLGMAVRRGLRVEEAAALLAPDRPVLVLLDGLDELAEPARRDQALALMASAVAGDPHLWGLVSCRHSARGFATTFPENARRFEVRPLDDEARERLLLKWFTAAYRQQASSGAVHDPTAAARRAVAQLGAALGPVYALDPDLRALLSTPLFTTLQCLLFQIRLQGAADAPAPTDASAFFRQALHALLDRRQRYQAERRPDEVKVPALVRVLQDVAYRIQDEDRQEFLRREEWAAWLWPSVKKHLPQRDAARWHAWLDRHGAEEVGFPAAAVCWLHKDADVLTELAEDQLIFRHRGFQEMLAATELVRRGEAGLKYLAEHADGQTWRLPFLYAARQLGTDGFTPLATAVLTRPDWPKLEPLLQDTLALLGPVDPAPFLLALQRGSEAAQAAVTRLLGHREDRAAAPLREAIARLRGTEASTTAKVWVERTTGMRFLFVPGGRFQMGADDIDSDSQPAHAVTVSSFWLGETPVTNEQYRPFVEATQRTPALWNDARYNQQRQPVVGVKWSDAMAYCDWLSGRIDNYKAILPSEAQWERAARGDDGRRYPWGDKPPNETLAWYGQSVEAAPKPVGQYEGGRGPYGHLDLAGNVWEWCRDVWDAEAYGKPPHSASNPFDPVVEDGDTDWHSVRGGAYWVDPVRLQAAYRFGYPAESRNRGRGFRLCLSPRARGVRGA